MGDYSVIVIGNEYLDDEGNLHPLSELVPMGKTMPHTEQFVALAKGDLPGHEFRGNQYTGGRGGAGETHGSGHFLPLKSTEVVEKLGKKSILGGIQNTGFTR